MLPSYQRGAGLRTDADDINTRLAAPLMQIRKKNEGSSQPVGLVVLTVACCTLLLVQVHISCLIDCECMVAIASLPRCRPWSPAAACRPPERLSMRVPRAAALPSYGSA